MTTIYLCGPMDSVTQSEMEDWRKNATEYFESYTHVKTLDPCRRPHPKESGLTDKEIFELDIIDVTNSDILLADCRNLNKPTFGTPVEIFLANYIQKKPVIGWYDKKQGYRENSIFQNVLVTRLFPSLEEALDQISCWYLE
jgi:nucleoside 2-deoxyribosyltransferase